MYVDEIAKEGNCALCNQKYSDYGNNGDPVSDGRVCDACNTVSVIPARFEALTLGGVRQIP